MPEKLINTKPVDVFTWMIRNYKKQKENILRSDNFRIKGENEECCWYLWLYKTKDSKIPSNNFVTFQLEDDTKKKDFPNPVSIQLSLGTKAKTITLNEIVKTFSGFQFTVKEEVILNRLSRIGTLYVNLVIKSQRGVKNDTVLLMTEKKLSEKNFEPFLNSQSLSDVVFKIDESEFPAHKVVLASVSEVFQKMFSHNMEENLTNVVKLKQTDPEDFKELLNFIYTGQVENLDNVAFGLCDLANKYDISDLREICENHLYDSLSIDNVIQVLQLADRQNSVKLKDDCIEYIDRNFEQVRLTESFNTLNRELLMDLLCAVRIKMPKKS